jgi:four helix bundle protein
MCRSTESISSNIAEAEGRFTNRDALRIYSIARGSLWELNSQISVATERGLIKSEDAERLRSRSDRVGRLMGGIIRMRRENEIKFEQLRKKRRQL